MARARPGELVRKLDQKGNSRDSNQHSTNSTCNTTLAPGKTSSDPCWRWLNMRMETDEKFSILEVTGDFMRTVLVEVKALWENIQQRMEEEKLKMATMHTSSE